MHDRPGFKPDWYIRSMVKRGRHPRPSAVTRKLARNIPLFNKIRRTKKKDYSKLFSSLTPTQIHAVCECLYNTLHTNLGIPAKKASSLKKTLLKNKEAYLYLSRKKNPISNKRRLLVQHGTGIGLILSAMIPIISGIVSLFRKKKK